MVAKLRLSREQEELLDNLQARILPQLDLVRRLGQFVLPGVEDGAWDSIGVSLWDT